MPNVELTPMKLNAWRKIALGSWRTAGDPSVYGILEINAARLTERQKAWTARTGKKITLTTIVAKAMAVTLHHHPQINGLIRWGRIYHRKQVSVFLQTAVDEAGKELSGFVIVDAEQKSLSEIADEIAAKAAAIRQDKDPQFKKAKSSFGRLPAFLMRWVLDFMSFLLYTLNLDLRWAGLPRDPFGSVMITSIGSLGLDMAFAPLVPYSRVPLLIAVGAVKDQVVAQDGRPVIVPTFKLCATFDHRFVDGVHAAKMAKTIRGILETDQGLDELGM